VVGLRRGKARTLPPIPAAVEDYPDLPRAGEFLRQQVIELGVRARHDEQLAEFGYFGLAPILPQAARAPVHCEGAETLVHSCRMSPFRIDQARGTRARETAYERHPDQFHQARSGVPLVELADSH